MPRVGTAQRTSDARDFPIYNNGGKPDIAMDPQRFTAQMEIVDRYFEPTAAPFPRVWLAAPATGAFCDSTPSS